MVRREGLFRGKGVGNVARRRRPWQRRQRSRDRGATVASVMEAAGTGATSSVEEAGTGAASCAEDGRGRDGGGEHHGLVRWMTRRGTKG